MNNDKKTELEKTIVGILLAENKLIAQALTMLKPHYFSGQTQEGKSLRFVYELLVKELTNQDVTTQKAVDVFFLSTYHGFTDSDALSLINQGASTKNFESYCGALRRAYEKRKRQSLPMVLQSIENSDMSDSEKDLAYREAFQEAMDKTDENDNQIIHIAEAYKQTINEMQEQIERGEKLSGMSTGFDALDQRWGGAERKRVYSINGRSKMGKTSLTDNIVQNMAMMDRHCVKFELEMSRSESVKKRMASMGTVDYGLIRNASRLADNDHAWAGITHSLSLLKDKKLFIKDSTRESRDSIRAALQNHELKHGPIDVIAIDYPNLMENSSERADAEETARWLKLIANEFNCAVFALYQINKSVDNREDKRPTSSDLAFISESHFDVVAIVYRDARYHENSPFGSAAEIITGVARNAEAGTDFLEWQGQYQRFVNIDESETNRLKNLKNAPKEERKPFKNRF